MNLLDVKFFWGNDSDKEHTSAICYRLIDITSDSTHRTIDSMSFLHLKILVLVWGTVRAKKL
jgi:hypothetical protein